MVLLFCILFAYLLGSISSAILICKTLNLPDPRSQGSKNPGATNVLRIAGKKAALAVLTGDIVKGVFAVAIAKTMHIDPIGLSLIACSVTIGHIYPIFFHFQGGKGVATACGAILIMAWPLGIALIMTWLIIAKLFRYSSLAALITTGIAPFYSLWLAEPSQAIPLTLLASIIIWRHRRNIRQLLQGSESKISVTKQ